MSFVAYSGLWITDTEPAGDAGLALQNNFRYIAEKITSLEAAIAPTPTQITDTDGSVEIDWSSNNLYILTLNRATSPCSLTFVDPVEENRGLTLILKQDTSGDTTITWPSNIYWAEAALPVVASGVSEHTYCCFRVIDNVYYGTGYKYGVV